MGSRTPRQAVTPHDGSDAKVTSLSPGLEAHPLTDVLETTWTATLHIRYDMSEAQADTAGDGMDIDRVLAWSSGD